MNLMNQIRYLEEFDLPLMFSGCSVPEPLVFDDVVSAIVRRCGLLTPLYSEPETMQQLTALWFRTNQWNFEHLVNIILAEYSPIENTDRYSDHSITREDNGSVTVNGTDSRTVTMGGSDRVTTDEDGTQTGTETHSGTDTRSVTNGGSDTTQTTEGGTDTTTESQGGSDTTSATTARAAFNTSAYDPYDRSDGSTTYGRTDTGTTNYGHTEAVTATYGSTSQDSLLHGEKVTNSETTARDAEQVTTYGRTEKETGTRGTSETRSGAGLESYTEHTHGNIGVVTNQAMIFQELELLRKFNIYDWIAAKYEREMCIQLY